MCFFLCERKHARFPAHSRAPCLMNSAFVGESQNIQINHVCHTTSAAFRLIKMSKTQRWKCARVQIKPRVLIVFVGFESGRQLQTALVVCLMYARRGPGAMCVFFLLPPRSSSSPSYGHYYLNELEMCFESPKSSSMNDYPWRL